MKTSLVTFGMLAVLLLCVKPAWAQEEKYEHRYWTEAVALAEDSLKTMEQYMANANYPAAIRVSNRVLAGRLGRFYDVVVPCATAAEMRWLRALAFEQTENYTGAISTLDSLIRFNFNCMDINKRYKRQGEVYCKRGELKYRYLQDVAGSCQDLEECGRIYNQPLPVQVKKSECGFTQQSLRRRKEREINEDLFGPYQLTGKIGYVNQRASGVELGLYYGRGLHFISLLSYGPALSAEILGYKGTAMVVPKVSYEINTLFFGAKADLSYHNALGQQDLRLTPQVGLNLTHALNLKYGYSISLSGKKPEYLSASKLSLYLNVPRFSKIGG